MMLKNKILPMPNRYCGFLRILIVLYSVSVKYSLHADDLKMHMAVKNVKDYKKLQNDFTYFLNLYNS